MKKLIIGLFALAFFAGAKAQPSKTQLEEAKFAILKKTVEFLSRDTAFKKVQSHTCEGCKTVEDLQHFTATNNLTNADTKIITPLVNTTIDTAAGKWQQSLHNFEQTAVNQLTGNGKGYRKQLNGYADYTAALDAIVTSVANNNSTTPENDAAATKDVATPARAADSTSPAAATGTVTNNLSASILSYLPYVLAVGLLFAFIFIFLENKKLKIGKEHYKKEAHNLKIEVQQKAQTITTLSTQKEQLEKELSDSELDRKSLEDRLRSLEAKKMQAKTAPPLAAPAAPPAAEKPAPKPIVQPPKPPATKIKFARYADMGDGFSNAELLDKADGETIFEIIIAANNNTGEYKVTANPDAQRYALSNAQYFLGKTCLYDSFPSGDHALIKTDTPGTVKLTGGKWTIVNPAKISFS